MPRAGIPKTVSEAVMREFNHKCAICGLARPQLHHIDEDHSNSVVENLLPLCPNHHLLDQHNPTAPIDTRKLALFRKYKDPLILSPQFEPLFRRMAYLLELNREIFSIDIAQASACEVVDFVTQLQLGQFYGKQLQDLLCQPVGYMSLDLDRPQYLIDEEWRQFADLYFGRLIERRDRAMFLAVELLRYQGWTYKPSGPE